MNDRARFERLVTKVLEHEGGYVNDPKDPGGETKYGISKRTYPELDIKELTLDQAKDIYYRDYWLPVKGPAIQNDRVAGKVLDMAVNLGRTQAIKILQRAIRDRGLTIEVDGLIGPRTITAANGTSPDDLMAGLREGHEAYYRAIVARKPTMNRFINGWLKRARA